MTDQGIAFAIVPLSGMLFFAAVVLTLAIVHVRRPETHKRLMLLASISLLDAAVARWFLTFLAPPGPPGPPPVSGHHPAGLRRLSAAGGRDRPRLARPRASASGLRLRRPRAAGGETAELADQRHRGVAFAGGRHTGDGALAGAAARPARAKPL